APLHAVSTRTDRQPVSRSDRFHAVGYAAQHGAVRESRSRALPALRRGVATRAIRRARARRRALHSLWMVAPGRITGAVQRARELLLERRPAPGGAVHGAAARGTVAARPAGGSTRGVAGAVRRLGVHGSGNFAAASVGRAARTARTAVGTAHRGSSQDPGPGFRHPSA